jgi:hypothetical protein
MIDCEAMTVAHRRKRHRRVMEPPWHEQIKRILDGGGVCQKQCSLAEIIQHQSGENDGEPAEADRQPAEMAHIRIHRLSTGER